MREATYSIRGISLAIDDLARTTGIAFRALHDRWDSDSMRWRLHPCVAAGTVARF